jgi:tape measure domain-containing protein
MDQGVRYVVSIDGGTRVITSLRDMEGAAARTDASIVSLNNALRGIAGAFGVGFGLHALVDFGKDAIQGAADYETAVKRIKFASADLRQGVNNAMFIRGEVDKFKIPLQSATDSYGKFLGMLAGSDIASGRVRKLHDHLLLIGKVKGLGDGQLDAAVMNLGKMLESGSLDAKHFRPLEQQLSGIGAFVAKELGITVHQLALLRNEGKLTQVDPQVLLNAIDKQAASLEKFLPEATNTIQSQLNEIDTAWVEFKNNLVYDNMPALKELFGTLKEGIAWLQDHREGIVTFGKAVLTLGEAWLKYKIAMGAISLVSNTYQAFMTGMAAETEVVTTAVASQTVAYNSLAAAIERLNYVQATQAGMPTLAAMSAAKAAQLEAGAVAGAGGAAVGAGGAAAMGAGGTLLSSVAMPVIITAIVGQALDQMFGTDNLANGDPVGFFHPINEIKKGFEDRATINRAKALGYSDEDIDLLLAHGGSLGSGLITGDQSANIDALMRNKDYSEDNPYFDYFGNNGKSGKGKGVDKIVRPNDHVTGQRVVTYNIQIKEINGIKQNTVENGGNMQTDAVAAALRDVIISVVNDSQLTADH